MTPAFQWTMRLCMVLSALFACSCVDVREEYWLHQDGSAEAEITCQMPRVATLATGGPGGIRELADRILAKESCVDSYEVQVTERQKRVTLKIHCKLDDVMDLETLRESISRQDDLPPPVRKMVGEFEVGLKGISGISVTRTVAPAEAVPALLWLPKSKTEGHGFVKIMHFPRPISDHNAHECWDNGCTLMWESTLSSAIQTPMVYEFVMPIPMPWGWIIGGALALLALLLLVWRLRKRRAGGVHKKAA